MLSMTTSTEQPDGVYTVKSVAVVHSPVNPAASVVSEPNRRGRSLLKRMFRYVRQAAFGLPNNQEAIIGWLKGLYPERSMAEIQAKLAEHAEAERTGRLLNLQYPPSYRLEPRWGSSGPVHQGLARLFERHVVEYDEAFQDLVSLLPWFETIPTRFANDGGGEPGWVGGPINAVDSALLYSFVKRFRPRTYLEIGSGVTTLFAARAKSDHRLSTRIISIDPKPRAEIDARCDEVIRAPLELCDLSVFESLQAGDIVFMDGSHISMMNSDVTVFMLDVVPKLKPGVVVHFHDIHLPYDYPEMFVKWHWNEEYILAAYLLGASDRLKIIMPSRYAAETASARKILDPLMKSGLAESESQWLSGGSLWFTHTR